MKAEITKKGTLVLTPETELEDFALRCWWEKVPTGAGSVTAPYIRIETSDGNRTI